MTIKEVSVQDARVSHAINARVDISEASIPRPGSDDPFFVVDLEYVAQIYHRWTVELPQVRPFYAVKCNGDRRVIKKLRQLGAGFDCASGPEILKVMSVGALGSDVVLSNPCKSPAILDAAVRHNVKRTVFDNIDELDSIAEHAPKSELFLRIWATDPTAKLALSDKFGAHPAELPSLFTHARRRGLNVTGICFHIGSGAHNPKSMYSAIQAAHSAFSIGTQHGFKMRTLDLGGGYAPETFADLAQAIRSGLRDFGFIEHGTEVIAEPGTLFVQNAFRLVSRVNSRKTRAQHLQGKQPDMLYVSDGIFGSFMNVLVEKTRYEPKLIMKSRRRTAVAERAPEENHFVYTIWGPTCDSTDCVVKDFRSPHEIFVGDWLVWEEMGAYSSACATNFNGFPSDLDTIYV